MTKKLLSVLLALVMALCFMPTLAFAEDAHIHCVCGGEHSVADHTTHTDVTWTGVSDLSEIAAAGNYYLKNDMTLSDTWTCSIDGVNLCLGGKTITGKDGAAVINVASGASLAITDCGTSGKITHAEGAKGRGIENNGTLTLWNGSISGNSIVGNGGGVYVSAGCTFTMYGGSITNNTADLGGGVWSEGTFTMHNGTISGNTATNNDGGVACANGTFTMNDGTISGNTATNNGGGVYVSDCCTFTMNDGTINGNSASYDGGGVWSEGTFTMNDGTINGNSASYGGGVASRGSEAEFAMNGGTISDNTATNGGGVYSNNWFTMHNGTISGNSATNNGGGVYNNGMDARLTMNGGSISGNTATNGGGVASCSNEAEFAMNGGTISGNTATDNGGGVYADFSGYYGMFTVSGTPVISGNVKGGTITDGELQGGTVNNLYLPSGKTVTVESGKPLTEGAMIGVTTGSTPTAGNPIVITSGSADKGYFQSDVDTYDVGTADDGKVVLQLHSFGGDYLHDETGHWQVCQNDGCTATTAKTTHSGGKAYCTAKAVCEICNQEYGNTAPSNHSGALEWVQTAKTHKQIYNCCQAVNVAEANHTWENGKCTVCNYVCQHTDTDKNHICDICGETLSDHTGGKATCTKKAVCDYCGKEYGETDPNNHSGALEWTQTATTHEKKWNCCNAVVVASEPHEWENGKCSECGYACLHSGGTATCTEKAVCEICSQEYGDLAPHELTHIDAKDATAAEFGNTEYWHCDVCDKYFSDENSTNEIALADTVISKLAPKIIAGDGATVTQGEKKALSFTSDAAFDDFLRVEVDGKTVNESSYTVKSGSTVVTLNADYVATLSVGEHTLGIVSESGTATAKFTVNKKAAKTTGKTDKPTTDDNKTSPQTGDGSNLALWFALLLASGGAVIGTTVVSRKKKYDK